jgi:xanthine/uracil permease
MLDWIDFGLFTWLGIGGVALAVAAAVAYFFPPFRNLAIVIGGAVVAIMFAYTKGNRDRAKLEAERREKAVKKVQEKYDEIDARPDSDSDVDKRLRDGSF